MTTLRISDLKPGRRVLVQINGQAAEGWYHGAATDRHGRRYKFRIGDPNDHAFVELTLQAVRELVTLDGPSPKSP